jgi:N-acetylneuraminic acid mutarotase
MKKAWSFSGACTQSELIYVFGGLDAYSPLNSIEQYSTIVDKWTNLYVKLPLKLAKIGIHWLNQNTVLIFGGVLGSTDQSYSYVNSVHQLDLANLRWSKLPRMNAKRTLYSNVPSSSSHIYAIGGDQIGLCERFDKETRKWQPFEGFSQILTGNDLQSFAFLSSHKPLY